MKIETYLNAMIGTSLYSFEWTDEDKAKRERQYKAFRNRILRMDAEKDERIKEMQTIYSLERMLNSENGIVMEANDEN